MLLTASPCPSVHISATSTAVALAALAALATAAPADDFAERAVPFLEAHCYRCHGPERSKGGIEVHGLLTTESAFRNFEFLDRIAEAVEFGEMPPEDEVGADELPSAAEREGFLRELDAVRTRLAEGDFPEKAGRATVRRLNRNEYSYTVRDLFGVSFLAGLEFPADGTGGSGFDNTGDALFIPPVLMEKYIAASRKVVDSLYADPGKISALLTARPDSSKPPEAAAREVLNVLGSLAFRRRIDDDELGRLVGLFESRLEAGDSYEDAFRGPFQALLLHPSFLFRVESDQASKSDWAVGDFELATRLSYFLWSSMPDRELFRLADQGKLSDPAVLEGQALRMLADPKAEYLARHFGGQWLGFDELREVANPDTDRFPTFTPSLRLAMYRESVEFLNHLLQENRPVLELVHAEYTFLNAELARHYGVEGISGTSLQKVSLTDGNRGGIIGQASVLTTTSMPLRTSPVRRGKWVLDNLLGTPPPPPPQDAGVLPADDRSASGLSFREQLELHRDKRTCAGCHEKLDPLGFGLENFDAIGRWRDLDVNGKPVDSDAVLPDGTAFSTPLELKRVLLDREDLFVRNISRKMLAYALGRPLEYYDEPTVRGLAERLRQNGLRAHALVTGIVASYPFRHRSAEL